MRVEIAGYIISALFVVTSVVLSAWQIWAHLLYNPHGMIRKCVIRILLMVPIYAVESWLGLVFKRQSQVFSALRDCYEAFVIYSFFLFLVEYLGGLQHLADTLRAKHPVKHMVPFCCMKDWTMGAKFLKLCSVGVLQYVPIKLSMAVAALITSLAGIYGDGEFRPTVAYPWIAFVTNCSQIWAMYCLVLFYVGTKEELAPIKPVYKILSIKAIVFFTYWQSVLISGLVYFDIISADRFRICHNGECWTTPQIAEGIQDFIICIEMLCFSVAHHYVFSVDDFVDACADVPSGTPAEGVKAPLLSNLMDAINVTDVAADVKNSQKPILTRKQALAAKWDAATFNSSQY